MLDTSTLFKKSHNEIIDDIISALQDEDQTLVLFELYVDTDDLGPDSPELTLHVSVQLLKAIELITSKSDNALTVLTWQPLNRRWCWASKDGYRGYYLEDTFESYLRRHNIPVHKTRRVVEAVVDLLIEWLNDRRKSESSTPTCDTPQNARHLLRPKGTELGGIIPN